MIKVRLGSLLLCGVAMSMAQAAFAQDAPSVGQAKASTSDDRDSAGKAGLEEIIVTAQKRAEPLQSVPVSVSAFSSDGLERAHIADLTGLRGLVPGLTITKSGFAMSTPQISLRGISIQDVLPSLESGIGVSVDGIPNAYLRGTPLDAFDLQRVEVLRGPQGVLAGRNSTGGTINLIRTRPDPDAPTSGKIRFTGGSFGQNDYEGMVLAPIVPGVLAGKIAISVRKDNGKFKNVVTGDHDGDRDMRSYTVALAAKPVDGLDLYLSADRMEDDSQVSPFIQVFTPDIQTLPPSGYFSGANLPCFNPSMSFICGPIPKSKNSVEMPAFPGRFRLNALTFEGRYDLGALTLVSLTGYRRFTEQLTGSPDATRFNLLNVDVRMNARQFSEEVRAESSFDGPLNFVAGAFYMNYRYFETQRSSLDVAAIDLSTPPGAFFVNAANTYETRQANRTGALFIQADYDITDRLRLTVGGRQTWDHRTTDYTLFAPELSAVRSGEGPLVGRVTASKNFRKFTPKVGVRYEFTPAILAYASYSRGYNTGGFNGRTGSLLNAATPYKPEVLEAFEVGLKSELFDRRVRFNLSAFHNTLNDKQENAFLVFGTTNLTTTVNAAKARYDGVEVELAVSPVRGWSISSSLGYLDARYAGFTADLGQGTTDLTDLKLRRTPKWTAGMISDYAFDAGPGQLGFNAAVYYTSRYETDVLNDPRGSIPPVTKVDMSVRYSFPLRSGPELEIAGFVKNLTNNTTYDGYSSGNAVGTFIDFANPSPPRTWGASLTARF